MLAWIAVSTLLVFVQLGSYNSIFPPKTESLCDFNRVKKSSLNFVEGIELKLWLMQSHSQGWVDLFQQSISLNFSQPLKPKDLHAADALPMVQSLYT